MKLIGEQDYIIFHHTMCIQSSTSCEIFERIHIKMIKYHTVSPLTNFHSFKGTIGCLLFPTRSLGKRRGFAENPKGFQGTEGITHCITIWHRPLLVNRGGLELWLWRDDFLRHWLIFFRGIYRPPTYFGHCTKDEVLIDFVFIFQRCLLHLELTNISWLTF